GTPSEVAARVRTRYANMLLLAGEFGTAEREAIEAVRLARAVGALLEEADALVTQFVCRGEAGDILRALQLAAEARPPVLETCDARIVRRYFTNLTWILHCFGRYEEAVAVGLEGIDLHVRAGLNRHGQLCMQENAAGALCALGRPREAAQLLGDGEGAFSSDTISIQEGLATIAMLEGDLAGVSARLAAVRAIPGLEALFLVPACATDATAALLRGDADSAIAAVRQGEAMLEEADRLPATQLLAAGVWALADAAEAGVVDVDAARAESDRLLTRLRDVAAAGEGRLPEPDARVLTGEAERSRLEPLPDAVRWRAAAAAWEALARPFDAAYARWREAQALANARGPRAELEHALSCAHASAKVVGTPQLVERIEQLARRSRVLLPGMRDAGGGAFPDLTPREREVLALVAEGRTNREIAQALFITDKTASVHVSNILGKLGAANRGEAAALAHSAGFELELSAQA
ncbi:MAG TPA: LuxR C-terminal-related transcriptional regulator, partial [Myxococcota bacterium]|nr:LuxR C-terminal-related transcriptional regulator [Myxococcota bacterium]